MSDACPCGSGRPYAACCGPFHAGAEPPDAESLMRSRYVAFVRRDFPYLWRTLDSNHDEKRDGAAYDDWLLQIREGTKPLRYKRLRILDVGGPDHEGYAHVLFHVLVARGRRDASFAERSRFVHDGTGWRYLDGSLLPSRLLPKPIEALTFDSFEHAARR